MVGVTGFEPATTSTPRKCASRAAPHPDRHMNIDGELCRIRTCALQFRRLALYPTELIARIRRKISSSSSYVGFFEGVFFVCE